MDRETYRLKEDNRLVKDFLENPCFETARIAFIACHRSSLVFPRNLLDFLSEQFQKDHDNMIDDNNERTAKKTARRMEKDLLLSLALQTDTLEDCFNLFRKELYQKDTKDTPPNNSALRMKLDRHLDEAIDRYLTNLTTMPLRLAPRTIPPHGKLRLKEKLRYYMWLIED